MEREFTDYDEWQRYGADPTYGQGVSPIQYPAPNPYAPPAPSAGSTTPPPTGGGGGKTPQQIEAEGRAFDAAQNPPLIGGYMANGVWVNGSPMGGGGGRTDPLADPNPGTMEKPNEGFVWPTLNLPRASFRDFEGFKPFKQPSPDEILNDPVLQAQLKEGNNRIKQDRAFRGILNTGDTLKDIFDWTSDRIKLGGHDAFDRAFKVYDVNERQNPFNTWSANKDKYFQEFNTNAPLIRDEFSFNQFEPAKRLWDQNYNMWAKQGDWLSQASIPPE